MAGKKYIVSVGAGLAQEPFISKLDEQGYGIIAFGKGGNSRSAVKKCDYFKELDTYDYQTVIDWLHTLPVKIDGAGSFAGGGAILTLQKILSEFNLPTKLNDSLLIGTNKAEQQKFYHQHGLSNIRTWTKGDFDLKDSKDTAFIVKPIAGRGSEGVKKVTREEIQNYVHSELKEDDVIQSLIEGTEYRVLVLVQNYEIIFLAPVKRTSFQNTFLLGRLFYSDTHLEEIKKFYQNLARDLNIKDAIIKSDIILANGHINLIEMDIGVGGGIYYKNYISKLMGYDLVTNYIRLIVDKAVDKKCIINKNLVMDYIFNNKGLPIDFNEKRLTSLLQSIVGNHSIMMNFLEPHKHGKSSSNAHFIFTIIHQNKELSNDELNKYINEQVFAIK